MKVPCFSLVVERLISKPQSGMERFLSQGRARHAAGRLRADRAASRAAALHCHCGRRIVPGQEAEARRQLGR